MFELDARGGTRYTEILSTQYGVKSDDSTQQRAEYIGGTRIPLRVSAVAQTSETRTETPQANLAAFSATIEFDKAKLKKSFTEHGYVIGIATVRVEHSYQQGQHKM